MQRSRTTGPGHGAEARLRAGTTRTQVPLICLVGASNELPESEELDALYDRFLLRFPVNQARRAERPLLRSGTACALPLHSLPLQSALGAARSAPQAGPDLLFRALLQRDSRSSRQAPAAWIRWIDWALVQVSAAGLRDLLELLPVKATTTDASAGSTLDMTADALRDVRRAAYAAVTLPPKARSRPGQHSPACAAGWRCTTPVGRQLRAAWRHRLWTF